MPSFDGGRTYEVEVETVTDGDENGSESVTLDGSGSSDPDGSISSYVWTENGNQIATGATPTVTLDVGTHTITLEVTDDGSTARSPPVASGCRRMGPSISRTLPGASRK